MRRNLGSATDEQLSPRPNLDSCWCEFSRSSANFPELEASLPRGPLDGVPVRPWGPEPSPRNTRSYSPHSSSTAHMLGPPSRSDLGAKTVNLSFYVSKQFFKSSVANRMFTVRHQSFVFLEDARANASPLKPKLSNAPRLSEMRKAWRILCQSERITGASGKEGSEQPSAHVASRNFGVKTLQYVHQQVVLAFVRFFCVELHQSQTTKAE